jgi:hypothetical protein
MITKRKLTVLVFLLTLGAAVPLAADIRFELGFGWTLVKPALNAGYLSQYAPPLTVGPAVPPPPVRYIGSSASQTVQFKGKTTYGMNGFFNVLFTENIGLQVLADYHRPGIGGSDNHYDFEIRFLAFEPETYIPDQPIVWPASKGNLTQTTFSLNALARFRAASNLSLSLSGGPSVFHLEGKAGYIGYTFFNLNYLNLDYELTGGTYQMVVEFGPQTKYGFNIGIEAAYEAFQHIILAFDIRWYGAPKSDLPLHIVEDDIIEQPIGQIENTIGLGALTVNPSYFRAGLAIRFVF